MNISSTNLDARTCYRAVMSRDARFDGRFFTGVTSTGIFCRPVCPAPTPKEKNCRFHVSAATAMAAGFRPCLRCRPEAAPNSPAWNGVSTTVTRALRLIDEGALDRGNMSDLAGRLGVGERHLRRLFVQHVGASPKAVAQTRRLLFAKKLITESRCTLTEVALICGFGSIRRFNDAMRKLYGRPARDLRRQILQESPNGGIADKDDPAIALKIPVRPPFDWQHLLGFLGKRAIPGMESVDADCYRRTIRLGNTGGVLEISPDLENDQLIARFALPELSHLQAALERLRRLLDLSADPGEIAVQLGADPALASSVSARPGLRVPGAWDPFELCIRAVLGQQVTVAGAVTLAGRLVMAFGTLVDNARQANLTHLFPTPEALAAADIGAIGLPRSRAETISVLSAAFARGEFDFSAAPSSQIEAQLRAIRGIGRWTAQYIAMRALGDPDAFPEGDLALVRAMAALGEDLDGPALARRAEAWRPWRAYAAMHLWSCDPGARTKAREKNST
ncbi:MAG: helix-turn-helix domain-containing protein [Alphaproteobacteria bacterium]|nr:helix-turn-helix domain-containing protein [Alphaproteobacteria bacterium]